MTDDDPTQYPKLADLHLDTVRAENDHVDQRFAELQEEVRELEDEVATLEDEKEDLREEKEAAEELLDDLKEGQRQKQLNRIKEANEAVSEDTEVDLSTLEDASVDQLETVAEMLESAAGTDAVSNTDRAPDVGGADPDGTGGADELADRKAKLAEQTGLSSLYEQAQEGFNVNYSANGAQIDDGVGGESAIDAAMEGGQ